MPARAKAKARAKRRDEIQEIMSPQAQKALERKLKKEIGKQDDFADECEEYVQMILAANSDEVAEAVDHLTDTMKRMQGTPRFVIDGIRVNVEPEILANINHKIHRWVAVRLLVAAAEWDIRIANFKLPKDKCARCGKRAK